MKRPFAVALVFALTLLGGASVHAAAPIVWHTVKPGDSLPLLAAEYYGNRQLAVFILAANGIEHAGKLKPGRKLKIPTSWRYTVKQGETLATIAAQELGDARRAEYLADVNAMDPAAPVAPGTELTVPFHIQHRTATTESFRDIARAYYGNTKRAELIKSYNFRSGTTSAAKEALVIPVEHVKVRPSKLPAADPADAAAQAERDKQRIERIQGAIAVARERLRDGRYEDVAVTLLPVLSEDDPNEADLGEIHWLLGNAYVALGQRMVAVASFREVVARRPQMTLDPALISPKVRQAFDLAKRRDAEP